jgi:hypothetical protein
MIVATAKRHLLDCRRRARPPYRTQDLAFSEMAQIPFPTMGGAKCMFGNILVDSEIAYVHRWLRASGVQLRE